MEAALALEHHRNGTRFVAGHDNGSTPVQRRPGAGIDCLDPLAYPRRNASAPRQDVTELVLGIPLEASH